ncbi:MAG: helix-turn-helix domain-containing protein [Microbacteriaceae bacterium]|nr:helix-turn-helix domain-containing protein [Microbacteriaceae bacterium]
MGMAQLVSRNLRRIRGERGLSLAELARRAGLSKQTLSTIEQGDANPTIETVAAIAEALGVSFRALVTDWGSASRLVRGDDVDWRPEAGGERAPLMQLFGSGYVRTALLRLDPAEPLETRPPESTGALHHVYVLDGEIEAGPEHELERLRAGDHLTFPADRPHRLRALDAVATAHLTSTSPQQAQFARG